MYAIDGVAIRGVASVVPRQVARTEDYDLLTPDERARFAKATGIQARHIANPQQCASDFCGFAVDDLLSGIRWSAADVGLMVLITQTGDYPVPATSIVLQNKLKLPQECICFDVNLGCSAYPYGLAIMSSMMKSLSIRRGLLLVGDVSSKVCAYTDKSSWPLFGDAGSATALELDAGTASSHFLLMNDGSGKDAIIVPAGGLAARVPTGTRQLELEKVEEGIVRNASNLVLKGSDIFTFAIQEVPKSINAILEFAGVDKAEIDYFVLHQANRLINETIRTKVGASRESFLYTLGEYGNTSSVSIPLTLSVHGEKLATAKRVLLSGFGVGLSWGSAVVLLPDSCYFSLTETDDAYPG
jgi:3-oxoacyl-[acyl-carrier-protein] synthase III